MNLYHYTSVKNLARILDSRQMRFSRLDTVFDPLDGTTDDYPLSQKIAYVSCFTKREEDSLLMWKMYTPDMNGVRIKFDEDLFGVAEHSFWGQPSRHHRTNYFDEDSTSVVFGPIPIKYRNADKDIRKSIVRKTVGGMLLWPLDIGLYKHSDWSFEDEVRYRLLSFNATTGATDQCNLAMKMEKIKESIYEDRKFILVELEETSLQRIELLLGPRVDRADVILVEALVEKYCPGIEVEKSRKRK